MNRILRWALGGVIVVAMLVAGTGIALAAGPMIDDGRTLTGTALARASTAAFEATGGGEVVDSEVGRDADDAAYSLEIVLEDGRQVEVNLNEAFAVIGHAFDED